jgi:glycerophosphoryl diester phosphodiesterase
VLTLSEMLVAARSHILLNLDVKEPIYAEVVAAVERAGVSGQVVIETLVDESKPPRRSGLAAVLSRQTRGPRRIPGVESVFLAQDQFAEVSRVARQSHIRVWANTLTSIGVISIVGLGGYVDALRDSASWSRWLTPGPTMIETDEPGHLQDYERRQAMK